MKMKVLLFATALSLSTLNVASRQFTVCYNGRGCLQLDIPETNNGWTSSPPQSPEEIDTKFRLFTASDRDIGKEISATDTRSFQLISPNAPLAFTIHGLAKPPGFGPSSVDLVKLVKPLLGLVPQVIVVDWEKGAQLPLYDVAVANSQVVGRQIGDLVEQLRILRNLNPRKVHLIGHSLGAHVAGFAGKWLRSEYKQVLGRISALDAAGPRFSGTAYKVTRDDAKFVDAIHTSVARPPLVGLGIREPFAHVDFYVDGGHLQNHCRRNLDITCSHSAAVLYYRMSVERLCDYRAKRCDSLNDAEHEACESSESATMGYFALNRQRPAEGIYALTTTRDAPFCEK